MHSVTIPSIMLSIYKRKHMRKTVVGLWAFSHFIKYEPGIKVDHWLVVSTVLKTLSCGWIDQFPTGQNVSIFLILHYGTDDSVDWGSNTS